MPDRKLNNDNDIKVNKSKYLGIYSDKGLKLEKRYGSIKDKLMVDPCTRQAGISL